jgi:hypothetical protein
MPLLAVSISHAQVLQHWCRWPISLAAQLSYFLLTIRQATLLVICNLFTNPGTYYVVNQAVVDRTNTTKQYTSRYNPSVSAYGIAKTVLDAPVATDSNAQNLALYESRKLATPDTYVERIDFNALAVGTYGLLYPDFLATELSDQVSVVRTTYDGRTIQWNLVVEGMAHNITQNNWMVSYTTSAINPYSITI